MKFKHYSMLHFSPQLFSGIGGGAAVGPPPPVYAYIREPKTLGLGLALGIITYTIVYHPIT